MWSSRLFWKLFIAYASVNLMATITFVVIVSGWQQVQVVEQIKQRLSESAALVRSDVLELLPQGRTEALQSRIRHLGTEIDTRITLVAMNGLVLADSQHETVEQVAKMENHKDRVELVQAATHGRGSSERVSPTLGHTMLYVALRADGGSGEQSGLVRTALPMTQVQDEVAAIQRLVWLVAVVVSLSVVGLTYFVAARVVQPVRQLTEAAESIAAGTYDTKFYLRSSDELGTLAKSFNRMSDQLQAREVELHDSRQRLATVLEGMVEGVLALDHRERIVLANRAAGQLLNFAPANVRGRPLIEVNRNHALHQALNESQESESVLRAEIQLGDEEERVLSVNITRLPDDPTMHSILVLQDVTELRKLDLMRQEFVANVSHELKTPLSSIKAYAETLTAGAIHDDEHNVQFVQRIEEQADRLHELILDLLSLARIESGQQTFDIESVKVEAVVGATLAEYQTAAGSKGIRLTSAGDPVDLELRADPEGVREILGNLVDNALKYTLPGGEVAVTWQVEGQFAVIQVRDSGMGIAAEHLPRVFERFYRVDKARSRELGGTGLGLSIVKHLAQSFDGSVEVESEVGAGTVFSVKLPVGE